MEPTIYVAKIVYSTSVDGVGLRNSLYVSGCPLHCKGCHNQAFWDIQSGTKHTVQDVFQQLNADDFNISILGGEPLLQYESIVELCKLIKKHYPQKTIWLWSGYTIEYIKEHFPLILQYINVLIDGRYIQKLADPNLKWRGSSNQRIIHLNKD